MSYQEASAGTVLVTGASGGVGRVLVKHLAERGYRVLGSVLNQRELDALSDELTGIDLFEADFSEAENGLAQVRAALAGLNEPLYAAISCVGANPLGPLETTPMNVLRSAIEINAISGVAIYQATLPYLRKSHGRLVLVSSMSGKMAMPLLGYYTASKFALEGLADTMRLEAGQWNVPVSLIEPGAIATNMVHGFSAMLASRFAELDEEGRANYGDYFSQQGAFASSPAADALAPADVAQTIIEVLESADPEARYAIGTAKTFLETRRTTSDKEMDAMVNGFLPGMRQDSAL